MQTTKVVTVSLMLLFGLIAGFAAAPTATAHACHGGGCGGDDCGHDIEAHLHSGQHGTCLSFPLEAQN